jgi:phosphohistidine phosphatase
MKTLLLIRHASADYNMAGHDFDRPLNNAGKKEAAIIGNRLKDKNLKPDLWIASPARRAADTARPIASALQYDREKIAWKQELYHASLSTYSDITLSADDRYDCIAIVGHNPAISQFADSLSSFLIDYFPPCCVAAYAISADSWKRFPAAEKRLLFLSYPEDGERRR